MTAEICSRRQLSCKPFANAGLLRVCASFFKKSAATAFGPQPQVHYEVLNDRARIVEGQSKKASSEHILGKINSLHLREEIEIGLLHWSDSFPSILIRVGS